jgi:hypothetical protein
LMVKVLPSKQPLPAMTLADAGPVRIAAGDTAEVRLKTPARAWLRGLDLELSEPPAGVSLVRVDDAADGVTLVLKADKTAQAGVRGNLIVEAVTRPPRTENETQAKKPARNSVAFLPAIPF